MHEACLDLEFRLYGRQTIGVWGGLSEEDRRMAYPIWLKRNQEQRISEEGEQ